MPCLLIKLGKAATRLFKLIQILEVFHLVGVVFLLSSSATFSESELQTRMLKSCVASLSGDN